MCQPTRRWSLCPFILLLLSLPLPSSLLLYAQPDPEALEAQLETAAGEERLAILVDLASHYRQAEAQRTIAVASEALKLLETYPDRSRQVEIFLCLSEAHVDLEENDIGLSYASRAESLATPLDSPSILARVRYHSARAYARQRQFEQAIHHYFEARDLFEGVGNMEKAGRSLAFAADAYRELADYDRALAMSLEAVEYHKKSGNHLSLAAAFAKAGTALRRQGHYEKALGFYLESYEWYLQAGIPKYIVTGLNNIGLIYLDLENYDQALNFFQQALKVNRGAGRQKASAVNLNNIGSAYIELGRYEEAVGVLLEGLSIRQALGSPGETLIVHLGRAYLELGELEKAGRYYRQGLEESRRIGSRNNTSSNLQGLAWTFRLRGDLPAALESAEAALEVALEVSARDRVQEIQLLLSEIYADLGRHKEALDMFKRHTEIRNEIFNKENSRSMVEMQARFEAGQKEQEIELLKQRQAVSALELEHEHDTRRALVFGFSLVSLIALLLFNRYRLKSREATMLETVRQEQQVSRRLREIDKLKDDFLANTSHELRTPLYGITGLAESLADGAVGELPEAAKANLAMITASGRRLSALVDDILDFSKLRRKGLELDLQPVDLHALTDVVLTMSRPLVGNKQLELRNAVPADLPAATADENRLQQVLYNLVGNAVKFTESGWIEVSAKAADADLVVRVTDTGIGIAPEEQERIFKAFEQVDASAQRRRGGTGLGLAVTRELVESHGGKISLRSHPGEGSTFSFNLKIADLPVAERLAREPRPSVVRPALVEAPGEESLGEDRLVPGTSILVVDDEPVNLQVVCNYLSIAGFRLTLASSGAEALSLLAKGPFDLVLLDVMMPKMSGFEVCRVIRQTHPIEKLPILFLSAMDRLSDRVAGLDQGGNDYLTKPIAKSELFSRVVTHLKLLEAHRLQEEEVETLRGLLPICIRCKKIRDDEGDWAEIETYVSKRSEAEFSHGICPACTEELYPGLLGSSDVEDER